MKVLSSPLDPDMCFHDIGINILLDQIDFALNHPDLFQDGHAETLTTELVTFVEKLFMNNDYLGTLDCFWYTLWQRIATGRPKSIRLVKKIVSVDLIVASTLLSAKLSLKIDLAIIMIITKIMLKRDTNINDAKKTTRVPFTVV